jgi:hypothetical protein
MIHCCRKTGKHYKLIITQFADPFELFPLAQIPAALNMSDIISEFYIVVIFVILNM